MFYWALQLSKGLVDKSKCEADMLWKCCVAGYEMSTAEDFAFLDNSQEVNPFFDDPSSQANN